MITTGLFEIVKGLPTSSLFKGSIMVSIISIIMLFVTQVDTDSKHYEKDFVNSLSLKVLKEIEAMENK